MKYLTKDELENIMNKLTENPTKDTLKELNEEYNGEEVQMIEEQNITSVSEPEQVSNMEVPIGEPQLEPIIEQPIENDTPEMPNVEIPVGEPQTEVMVEQPVEPIPTAPVEEPVVTPLQPEVETPVVNPLPNVEVPMEQPVVQMPEVPEQTTPINNVNVGPEIPSFEVPQMVTPENNNSANQEPINFTGNLWEPQQQENLMNTTDNFNNQEVAMSNTEVPVQNGPFFGNTQETVNNPIPIQNGMPHIPQGPSMFGQFEQNYNG